MANEGYKVRFFKRLAKDDVVKIVAYVLNEWGVYGYFVYVYTLEEGLPVSYPVEIDETDEQIKAVLLGAIKCFEKIALINTVGKRIARVTVREIDREELFVVERRF